MPSDKKNNPRTSGAHNGDNQRDNRRDNRRNGTSASKYHDTHHDTPQKTKPVSAQDHAEGKLFAAIDLGTNNCRLLVVTPDETRFSVVDSFSRIVRLGEGLEATGRLSDDAMDRTLAALKICAGKIRHHKDIKLRCVATEACRDASNGQAFIARVLKETGLRLEIIGGRDEAELAAIGCGGLFDRRRPNAIVFDIGGGSTELTRLKLSHGRFELKDTSSIPLGVVRLAERYDSKNLTPKRYAEMVAECRQEVGAFFARQDDIKDMKTLQLLGTSGTVTTLAAIQLGLKYYDRDKVDGCTISKTAALDVMRRLVKMNYKQLTGQPCIGADRADLVLAGCAMFEALLDYWPVPIIRVADRGVRDGILLRMIRKEQRKYKPGNRKIRTRPSGNSSGNLKARSAGNSAERGGA